MKKETPFRKVYEATARLLLRDLSTLRFHCDGSHITDNQTPEMLEMEDGAEIEMKLVKDPTAAIVDTKMSRLVVEEMSKHRDNNSVVYVSTTKLTELQLHRGDIVLLKAKNTQYNTLCVVMTDDNTVVSNIRMSEVSKPINLTYDACSRFSFITSDIIPN